MNHLHSMIQLRQNTDEFRPRKGTEKGYISYLWYMNCKIYNHLVMSIGLINVFVPNTDNLQQNPISNSHFP